MHVLRKASTKYLLYEQLVINSATVALLFTDPVLVCMMYPENSSISFK